MYVLGQGTMGISAPLAIVRAHDEACRPLGACDILQRNECSEELCTRCEDSVRMEDLRRSARRRDERSDLEELRVVAATP